jgi:1,4-dihydroxy-2-naphthoate octaprenyltransferase
LSAAVLAKEVIGMSRVNDSTPGPTRQPEQPADSQPSTQPEIQPETQPGAQLQTQAAGRDRGLIQAEPFLTLKATDGKFKNYILGREVTIEGEIYRPIPMKPLNPAAQLAKPAEVTFRLMPRQSISLIASLTSLVKMMRPQTLILISGPLFVDWLLNISLARNMDLISATLVCVGVLSFLMSLNLFNDYNDHITGRDRDRGVGGTNVIQSGAIPAYIIRRLAAALLVVAIAVGVTVALRQTALVMAISLSLGFFSLLLSLDFFSPRVWFRGRGGAEFLSFVLSGPLLFAGFSWVVSSQVGLGDLVLGAVFGAITGLYIYFGRFEQLMQDQQVGFKTWPVRLGFDRARRVAQFLVLVPGFWLAVYIFFFGRSWYLLPAFVTLGGVSIPLVLRIEQLQSPLASDIKTLKTDALKLHWLSSGLLATGLAALSAAVSK